MVSGKKLSDIQLHEQKFWRVVTDGNTFCVQNYSGILWKTWEFETVYTYDIDGRGRYKTNTFTDKEAACAYMLEQVLYMSKIERGWEVVDCDC